MRHPPRRLFRLLFALALATSSLALAKPRGQHVPPDTVHANKPYRIEISLLDGEKVEKVLLRVRRPGHDFSDVPMTHKEGDTFEVTLPAGRMQPPGIEYYFEGMTFERERIPLFKSAEQPVRVFISELVPPLPPRRPRYASPPSRENAPVPSPSTPRG